MVNNTLDSTIATEFTSIPGGSTKDDVIISSQATEEDNKNETVFKDIKDDVIISSQATTEDNKNERVFKDIQTDLTVNNTLDSTIATEFTSIPSGGKKDEYSQIFKQI